MPYVQHSLGYTLKCDKCGAELHKEGKSKPFLTSNIDALNTTGKDYGWLISKRAIVCTYCRTFKRYKL